MQRKGIIRTDNILSQTRILYRPFWETDDFLSEVKIEALGAGRGHKIYINPIIVIHKRSTKDISFKNVSKNQIKPTEFLSHHRDLSRTMRKMGKTRHPKHFQR